MASRKTVPPLKTPGTRAFSTAVARASAGISSCDVMSPLGASSANARSRMSRTGAAGRVRLVMDEARFPAHGVTRINFFKGLCGNGSRDLGQAVAAVVCPERHPALAGGMDQKLGSQQQVRIL